MFCRCQTFVASSDKRIVKTYDNGVAQGPAGAAGPNDVSTRRRADASTRRSVLPLRPDLGFLGMCFVRNLFGNAGTDSFVILADTALRNFTHLAV